MTPGSSWTPKDDLKLDEGFDTTPDKLTWMFFAMSGISFLLTQTILPEIGFIGFIGFFLAATYSWRLHNKDIIERKKVLDTIQQL